METVRPWCHSVSYPNSALHPLCGAVYINNIASHGALHKAQFIVFNGCYPAPKLPLPSATLRRPPLPAAPHVRRDIVRETRVELGDAIRLRLPPITQKRQVPTTPAQINNRFYI